MVEYANKSLQKLGAAITKMNGSPGKSGTGAKHSPEVDQLMKECLAGFEEVKKEVQIARN